jgi:hypothetical protein
MAQTVTITLTIAGLDTGPFDLYSDADGYVAPFETGVLKALLVAGYTSILVPDAATIIRVDSTGVCTNFIDLPIDVVTPTTTTTSTSSTTTTTTTASLAPLFVYAKSINTAGDIQYSINAGSDVFLANISGINCDYVNQITGLVGGDVITFTEVSGKMIDGNNGFNAGCPNTTPVPNCNHVITVSSGPNFVYLTVDGSSPCTP